MGNTHVVKFIETDVCNSEVHDILVPMYGIPILRHLVGVHVKDDYAVVCREMLGISLDFSGKVVQNPLGVSDFIYGVLKADGTVAHQHLGEVGAHLVV